MNATTPQIPEDPTPQPIGWLTPQIRRWAYGVVTAVVPLLVVYGAVEQTTAPLWAALAASVLGTGTALAHTPAGAAQ